MSILKQLIEAKIENLKAPPRDIDINDLFAMGFQIMRNREESRAAGVSTGSILDAPSMIPAMQDSADDFPQDKNSSMKRGAEVILRKLVNSQIPDDRIESHMRAMGLWKYVA